MTTNLIFSSHDIVNKLLEMTGILFVGDKCVSNECVVISSSISSVTDNSQKKIKNNEMRIQTICKPQDCVFPRVNYYSEKHYQDIYKEKYIIYYNSRK